MGWTACPRCIGGQVFLVKDPEGDYYACLQCGFRGFPREATDNEARQVGQRTETGTFRPRFGSEPHRKKGRLLKL